MVGYIYNQLSSLGIAALVYHCWFFWWAGLCTFSLLALVEQHLHLQRIQPWAPRFTISATTSHIHHHHHRHHHHSSKMADNSNPLRKTTPSQKATLSSLPASWRLTDQQVREIFTTAILPLEITPFIPPSSNSTTATPTAIILLGQTGSGKTRLAPLLSSALSSQSTTQSVCHLIADTYKIHHPFYSPCLSQHPHLASALASPSARIWLSMACQSTSEAQIPVLVESACRHPSDFSEIVEIFSEAGYRVKVVILAVPTALSRLGVLVRYHDRLPESMSRGLPLRLTPRGVHDESYAGCVQGAEWVDEHPREVSEVVVVRRDRRVGYRNRSQDGKWKEEPRAREGLEGQRGRGLTQEERELAEQDLKVLEGLVTEGRVEQATVGELRGLLRELYGNGESNGEEELKQLDIDAFVKGGGAGKQEQPKPKSTKEILDELEFDDDDDINFYNTCSCCR